MMDLNKLSPAALKAAIIGGTETWGQGGSIRDVRYAEPVAPKSRRRCSCCKRRATHRCMANGVSLGTGCELFVTRWLRDPANAFRARLSARKPDEARAAAGSTQIGEG